MIFFSTDGTVLDPSVLTQAEEEPFDPWGRPGGGAPITNESGKVVTATQQHFRSKKVSGFQRVC